MQGWFDKVKAKITGKPANNKPALVTSVATDYEVNLVPDVKIQMIKAQKMRNLVLFICIVVAAVSVGVVVVLFGIKSGQDIAMANQDSRLEKMSVKMNDYAEIEDLVTIQRQLEKISELSGDKPVLSRVFGAMAVVLPQGDDVVQLSELRVDLENDELRMDGQADAKTAPLIDYRVLESLKKGMALTKYDYGRFVDAEGNEIPTWCINEADGNGSPYRDGEDYYVWWNLTADGCNAIEAGTEEKADDAEDVTLRYNPNSETESQDVETTESPEGETTEGESETKNKVTRVKIWRTPKFDAWHKAGYMELNGSISGIEHFVSACTQYSGTMQGSTAKWTSTNDCLLAPDGLTVTSSTNGRDESDNLVLKFSAITSFDPEFFAFRNKHMIAIGPMGQNVTDSYVQVGGMFTQEAKECAEGDTECLMTKTGADEDSNSNSNNEKKEEM